MEFNLTKELEDAIGPTAKIFNDDPYVQEIDARIVHVAGPYVITDRTIFYPESGGQQSDTGTINDIPVIELAKKGGRRLVVKREDIEVPAVTIDTIVIHKLAQDAPFKTGDVVKMKVDWAKRYESMRYHSASHFLYHAVHCVFDTEGDAIFTKGCSIDHEGARFDFFGSLEGSNVPAVEKIANDLIALGEDIVTEPEPLTNEIHYWRYRDIIIPCGGTHVKSAKELAPIQVKRSKKGASTTRIGCRFAT